MSYDHLSTEDLRELAQNLGLPTSETKDQFIFKIEENKNELDLSLDSYNNYKYNFKIEKPVENINYGDYKPKDKYYYQPYYDYSKDDDFDYSH